MRLEILRPLRVRRRAGGEDLHLKPGPVDLPDADAVKLLAKKPDAVRLAVQPGDTVEWMSEALPAQIAEILAIYADGTFDGYHPVSERVCRMPTVWIRRVVTASTNPEEPTP